MNKDENGKTVVLSNCMTTHTCRNSFFLLSLFLMYYKCENHFILFFLLHSSRLNSCACAVSIFFPLFSSFSATAAAADAFLAEFFLPFIFIPLIFFFLLLRLAVDVA